MPVDEDFIRRDNYVSNEPLHVIGIADKLVVVDELVEAIVKVAFYVWR